MFSEYPVSMRNVSLVALLALTVATASIAAEAWKVSPAGPLKSLPYLTSPATARGHIFFADNVGKVFSLEESNGKIVWSTPLAARANTSLVLVGNTIIVGTSDGFLNWVDAGSG